MMGIIKRTDVNAVEEFVKLIKQKQSVSRFVINITFNWDVQACNVLRGVDLRDATGSFICFNTRVKIDKNRRNEK